MPPPVSMPYSVTCLSLFGIGPQELTDLLAAPVDDAKAPESERKPLRLFEDATGKRGVMVSGLEEILCTSAREVFKVRSQHSSSLM